MKNTAIFAALCGAAFAMSGTAFAAPSVLGVTTGAGYIPMVKAVNEVCKAPDVKIEGHFGGNIGQELAQIEAGNDVSVVVSDASTLKKIKSKVTYTKTVTLGDDDGVEEGPEPQEPGRPHERLRHPYRRSGSEGRDLWSHRDPVALGAEA